MVDLKYYIYSKLSDLNYYCCEILIIIIDVM